MTWKMSDVLFTSLPAQNQETEQQRLSLTQIQIIDRKSKYTCELGQKLHLSFMLS